MVGRWFGRPRWWGWGWSWRWRGACQGCFDVVELAGEVVGVWRGQVGEQRADAVLEQLLGGGEGFFAGGGEGECVASAVVGGGSAFDERGVRERGGELGGGGVGDAGAAGELSA